MKKSLLLFAVSIIMCVLFIFSSCKKTTHYPHPSPGGTRITSYSVVLDSVPIIISLSVTPTSSGLESDNYAFGYDSVNRLSYVIFTCNNPYKNNTNAYFVYSNDTIYKSTFAEKPSVLLEKDTFIVNGNGMVTTAFTPGFTTTFQYFGKLLATQIIIDESTGIPYTQSYTSQSGNWLQGTSTLGAAYTQNFTYNLNYSNRPGDFLQINSFTMYGSNVYQYANMVTEISQSTTPVYVDYNIDAYSNVLNTTVKGLDITSARSYTATYSFQYGTY